jgi:alkanesulfonate monooxygenase SsuD/methylene tetrahydromethanopterin reductase-like flavin-dependent oxidoreductase (luciferase family)
VLTEGRFEMGIGVGRPGIEDELRERGLPVSSPGQRLDQVRETVAALRELEIGHDRTPVTMAVIEPRAQSLAAEIAGTSPSLWRRTSPGSQWCNGCEISGHP